MAQAGMPHDFIKRGELSRPRAKHFARSGRDEPIERRLALVEEAREDAHVPSNVKMTGPPTHAAEPPSAVVGPRRLTC